MARFHVTRSFALESRKLFILAGTIVEGVIRPGMFIRLPFNSTLGMTARIHSIEFTRRADGKEDDTCLCIQYDAEVLDLWRGLPIQNETIEVTADADG